ncbi:MAG: hypothetical protein FIB08_09340 [Candidatus Methanoperedens sp.]|nr:hypothetical protein [Candidatus Methanoperedens sp.]
MNAENEEQPTEEADHEYRDLVDAENELYNGLIKESIFSFAAVVIFGYIAGTLNIYLGYLVVGFIVWVVGFRLIGLSVAWGRIHSKRVEVGNESYETDEGNENGCGG